MKKIILLTALIFSLFSVSISQNATIKILQYNLLYFGLDDNGCDQSNNNIDAKCNYLKTIINYVQPDIFAVNEIHASTNDHDYLLTKVFLLNNLPDYTRGTVKGSFITQQVFYNTNTVKLKKENTIYASPRSIYEYVFYYNSPDLLQGDTVFFSLFVAHLKAGSESNDENDRAEAANNLMNYIYSNNLQNYILSGDLNLYGSSEQAYQYLTNYSHNSYSFVDPCVAGEWHDNGTYAQYHTQSTSYSGDNCKSGGGLDDRFDFILFSQGVLNGSNGMEYVNESFITIGQDGEHFNDGISYGGNTSVPSDVLNALVNNSDHLPVSATFSFNQTPAFISDDVINSDIRIKNPVSDYLEIHISNTNILNKNLNADIYNLNGIKIYSFKINSFLHSENISNLSSGIYFLKISDEENYFGTKKFIKE